jgi:putative membrane protein
MTRRITILAAVAAVAASWGASPARAQQPARAAHNDNLFAAAAAASDLAELTVSNMALQRASQDETKKFAQQMVKDHTQTTREMMSLAAAKSLTLPRMPDIKDQAEADALGGVTGEEFDRCYMKGQLAAHICAVSLFQAEAERGTDPDLKAFAAKYLPKLKEHLEMAKKCVMEHEGKTASK